MISQQCQTTYSSIAFIRIFQRFWRSIKQLFRRYGQWNAMKRQHQDLLRMEDRMLKDIGLSRADAVRMTRGHSFWKYLFQPEAYGRDKRNVPERRSGL